MAEDDRNPLHHTQKMKQRIDDTITRLREDIDKVDEPQLKAMFETSADVLSGLSKGLQPLRAEERERLADLTRPAMDALRQSAV